jgi:hypothetical protein
MLKSRLASYNASKAALAHWGNTLRVEMAPFESDSPLYKELQASLLMNIIILVSK